jgi:hypothetical protein
VAVRFIWAFNAMFMLKRESRTIIILCFIGAEFNWAEFGEAYIDQIQNYKFQ